MVTGELAYLLFIRRLDGLQTLAEKKANRTGKPIENSVFQVGQADLRWSRFKDMEPAVMHQIIGEHVFPFLRQLGGDGSAGIRPSMFPLASGLAALSAPARQGFHHGRSQHGDHQGDASARPASGTFLASWIMSGFG